MNKFEIRNLDLYYGTFQALKGINMDIAEHKITAMIGPSGCGKSTLLKSLNRMTDLVEGCRLTGSVTLDGEDVKDRLKKSALGLSGGQQQRLCIARALAVEPEVLLMDEPTSALDPVSTSKVEELAMSLKQNYTIAIVTHNMTQALRISDCTGFFLLGDLIEFGETEQIFSNPRDKRTEDYITGRFG